MSEYSTTEHGMWCRGFALFPKVINGQKIWLRPFYYRTVINTWTNDEPFVMDHIEYSTEYAADLIEILRSEN